MSPGYRWRCHKCELGNEPGQAACAHCGFPAIASAVEIAAARGEPSPIGQGYRESGKGFLGLAAFLTSLLPWPLG